jgi:hypothetical protein
MYETRTIYKNISNSPDIREVVALVEEIKHKINDKYEGNKVKTDIVSPYDQLSSKFARVNELRAQSTLNLIKLKEKNFSWLTRQLIFDYKWGIDIAKANELLQGASREINKEESNDEFNKKMADLVNVFIDNKTNFKFTKAQLQRIKNLIKAGLVEYIAKATNESTPLEQSTLFAEFGFDVSEDTLASRKDELMAIKNIICDSIFCLFEITRTLNLFGISHIFNYSYLANTHFKMAKWCQAYVNYHEIIDEHLPEIDGYKGIKASLEELLGKEDVLFLEPNYHNELAIQYYYSAIQTHNGGQHYKRINQSMSFLEDDYNDELTHFCAATERFRINTGFVRGKIKELKEKISISKIYNYQNYIPDDEL